MKMKRGIIQMLVAAVITLFAAGCSDMVEELKVQEELKFLTPGSYTISGTDYTIMKTLVTKNGESAGTVDSNGLVTINVDSSTTYEITVVKDGTLTLVKNDSSSVVTYVGKFTFKTKTETTLKNTADASDTIVFVMNAEIGALPDGTYEIDGTNYTISDKTVAKESDGSSAGSVGSDGIVTVNKSESEGLTITVFGDYSVEALKTTTADGETTKKFYKGAFESSIATLKKDGTDDSDTLVIKKIASAGNISYATTSVSKTSDDEPFTNELTKTGDGTVSYTSDNTAVATVNEDGEVTIKGAGTATITATVADSDTYTYATKTASYTLTVTQAVTYIGTKAPTEAKAVGDIVFSDGSATPYTADLTLTEEQKAAAVAVIYYAGSSAEDVLGAKTLGVGLKNTGTDSTLAWAMNIDTDITAIQCTPIGNEAATATFLDDTDGSDNWQVLCNAVNDEDRSGYYPAWEWVNAYATTTANLTGDYASGWYLPTVAELSMLYRAKDTVNSALEKAGGTEIADTGYWSSSQLASGNIFAWNVWFDDGHLNGSTKNANLSVCTVRAFSGTDAPKATAIGIKSKPDAVGDIVFSDGSATPYTADLTEEQKSKAVAVIYYAGSSAEDVLGAKTLGVGLKNAGIDSRLAWARYTSNTDKAEGYDTNITAIQCTPIVDEKGAVATAKFTGDLDGSDNWKALCDVVNDEDKSGNYPAWEWVNAYATTTANLTGDYANGWYLPTVAELSMLYRVKDTVNSALEKAGGTKIDDVFYWSSSLVSFYGSSALGVLFDDGILDAYDKSIGKSVCTVRAF